MRVPMIAGNWKMNTTLAEAIALVKEMRHELDGMKSVERVLCPPYISLAAVSQLLEGTSVTLGAQNVYFEEKGAYTGEVSPPMLAGICQYVIIGHSERRQYFGETGEIVNKKVKAAQKAGLKPILCIGEKLAENTAGLTEQVLAEQLNSSLAGVDIQDGIVIAYEPVWAIGTGKAATGAQANQTIRFVRQMVGRLYGEKAAADLRVLYGGSVTPANTTEIMKQPEIDGALVGGASLKTDQFLSIVRQTATARSTSS